MTLPKHLVDISGSQVRVSLATSEEIYVFLNPFSADTPCDQCNAFRLDLCLLFDSVLRCDPCCLLCGSTG